MGERDATEGLEHLGMPIPTLHEAMALHASLNDPDATVSVEEMFDGVCARNGNIRDLISIDECYATPIYNNLEKVVQTEEFVGGISAGYEMAIGSLTFLHFLRMGVPDKATFFEFAADEGVIPVLTDGEWQRVHDLYLFSLFDEDGKPHQLNDGRMTIFDLARQDARLYLSKARRLADVVVSERHRISLSFAEHDDQREAKERKTAYLKGFEHAFSQSIEMYVQTKEARDLEDFANL